MFETEKATDADDLPHAYREVSATMMTCACGRSAEHQLHRPTLVERASHSAPLIETEKGS